MPNSTPKILRNARTWQVISVAYWLALFVATHVPKHTVELPAAGADKIVHFAAFAVLAALLATAWRFSAGRLTLRHLAWLWVAIAVYAALDEWTQTAVGRDASFWDWVADVAGAVAGLLIFTWGQRRYERPSGG